MTQQVIDIGSAPDDSTGDPLRTSFDKTNDNFTELYAKGATEGLWNFNQTSTDTSTAPVSGRFKTNSGNYRTATQIAIHATTIQGIDRSSTLRTLLVGDLIQCQDKTNAAAWCRYSLQSLPVDHGTWFQLNVTFQADGGVASGDNQEIVFVFTAGSSNSGGGSSGGGVTDYMFNTSISEPPGSGQIRFNQSSQPTTTLVWINNVTAPGVDVKRFLQTIGIGTILVIQDKDDSSKYITFKVTSASIDKTTYWEFPVVSTANGSALTASRVLMAIDSGANKAPIGAEYITSTADATLTAERVLTDTATVTWDRTTAGQIKANAAGASATSVPPQGRLTLQTATPVMTTTQAAKTTLFYTPYVGNLIVLYNGTSMVPTTFAELSNLTTASSVGNAGPAAVAADSVYDLFVWSNAGTPTLTRGPTWTNDTTRSAGTALVMVNGIWLNNASITNGPAAQRGTYVGTIYAHSDANLYWLYPVPNAPGHFYVWNCYNRVAVAGMCQESVANWTSPAANTWRAFNGGGACRMNAVNGLAEDAVAVLANAMAYTPSSFGSINIGINNSNTPAALMAGAHGDANGWHSLTSNLAHVPAIGFNFWQMLESSGDTATQFAGTYSAINSASGMLWQGRM